MAEQIVIEPRTAAQVKANIRVMRDWWPQLGGHHRSGNSREFDARWRKRRERNRAARASRKRNRQ